MLNRSGKLALTILLLIFSLQHAVIAEEAVPDQEKVNNGLSPEQEALKKDKKMISQLMLQNQKQKQPEINVRDVEIEIGNNPVIGSESAGMAIVEFSDYSCSHCARYVKDIYPEIYKHYISTGKIRYTVIDYPLPGNDTAVKAAEAAYCADDQGKFWEMHEALMHDQESLEDLNSIASFVDLDINKFKNCLEIKKYNSKVAMHIFQASRLEIPSVPGFIIASIYPDNKDKVKGISYIRGAKPFEVFQEAIDKALSVMD